MPDICYFCAEPATSDEHVPPRTIFPKQKDSPDGKDFRINLITVRSCDQHNSNKSRDDEYLLYVLAMCLPSNDIAKSQFLTKVRRAIEKRPKLLDALLIKRQGVRVHDTVKNEWHETIAIQPDEQRLRSIFTHIAKGLYFHETGRIWPGEANVLIEFMLSLTELAQNQRQTDLESTLNRMLLNVPYRGQNPDVFSYQFLQEDGQPLVRMHFYGNTKVTACPLPLDANKLLNGDALKNGVRVS